MNLLEIKNIKKSFNGRVAVDDVSFDIKEGETLGIIGESGCGKTTLARMIMGLIKRDSGKINFDGKDFSEINRSETKDFRKKSQIIFQEPFSALNPKIRIGDSLIEPFIVHKICNKKEAITRGNELLEKVGLDKSYMERYPHEISGGQCQRVCIARAIALNPKLLILDEPVSSLDHDIQKQIIGLLMELKTEYKMTYLFITHDLLLAKDVCGRVGVMRQGKIVEIGSAGEIFNNPRQEYTKRLLEQSL